MADPFDELRASLTRAAEAVAPEVTEFVRSGLRDDFPPASAPGQRPHRRSGELEQSVQTTVVAGPQGPAFRVEATAPHAGYVQALGRDVLGDPEQVRALVARRLAERLNGNG